MSFNVGENIGPYQIVEKLGQGGMATVFKAYHPSLDRYVALKVLHPAFDEDKSFASRFQREARVVAKLEHPNIVPVYDYAEYEGRPYLIMKFIEGDTLKSHMTESPLKPAEVLKVVDAVGSALAYAHKQGVLHRDIKPSNVLIANDGQIYLADFGLARIAQSGESTMSSDSVMGTPQYISPEQAMGKKDLDGRTDLYSFGVMVYEMVVGQVPFSADTPFAIIHDHIFTPLPLPRKVNPNVSEPVERVLMKSLAKERTDRYEDVNAMLIAFKEVWNPSNMPTVKAATVPEPISTAATIQAQPASGPTEVVEKPKVTEPTSSPAQKRSPWMWVSIALIVVFCLAGLAFARNNHLFAKLLANRNQPTAVATSSAPLQQPTQAAQVVPTLTLPPPPNGQPNGNPPPPPQVQPPADADVHLNMALEAWHNNDLQGSMDEVQQAVAAHPDQNDFLIGAGEQLFNAGQYIGAAYVYLRVADNMKRTQQPMPPDLRDRLEQSFYYGAQMDGLPLYIPLDQLRNDDPALAAYAQARYALLHNNMDIAHQSLDELLRIQPNWPLAQLLNAEVMIHDGKKLEPRKILNDLMQSPHAQDWVKEQAGILLSKLP